MPFMCPKCGKEHATQEELEAFGPAPPDEPKKRKKRASDDIEEEVDPVVPTVEGEGDPMATFL